MDIVKEIKAFALKVISLIQTIVSTLQYRFKKEKLDYEAKKAQVDDHTEFIKKRSWRSMYAHLFLFVLSLIWTLSSASEAEDFIWQLNLGIFYLNIPPVSLLSFAALIWILYTMYNSIYIINYHEVRHIKGILSLKRKEIEITFDQVYGVSRKANFIDRMVDVGDVIVGTSMTGKAELVLRGIYDDHWFYELITTRSEKARQNLDPTFSTFYSD